MRSCTMLWNSLLRLFATVPVQHTYSATGPAICDRSPAIYTVRSTNGCTVEAREKGDSTEVRHRPCARGFFGGLHFLALLYENPDSGNEWKSDPFRLDDDEDYDGLLIREQCISLNQQQYCRDDLKWWLGMVVVSALLGLGGNNDDEYYYVY